MIELIPAIDIIEGKCVRLSKGDYSTKKVYGDPVEMALLLEEKGFERLHIVDLDGAKSRHVVNEKVLRNITSATSLRVDFGGGIKTDDDIEKAFSSGAQMVTIGSVAVANPDLFGKWLREYGTERIILGADVREGRIAVNGWMEDSGTDLMDFLGKYTDMGVRKVLCTDISRDGMLGGPSTDLYKNILEKFPDLHLIASGGIASLEDIKELDKMGIPAVVFGKAIYEGRIDLDVMAKWRKERE